MLTVRTSENTVITSFRLITERQDFSSVRTAENTVRARARIHAKTANSRESSEQSEIKGVLILVKFMKYFIRTSTKGSWSGMQESQAMISARTWQPKPKDSANTDVSW